MKKTIFFLCLLAGLTGMAQNPEAAKELVGEGVALHDEGRFEEALAKYDAALAVDSNNLIALSEKGLTLHAMQREEEAVAICYKAIELYPDSVDLVTVYVSLGNALDNLNRSTKALQVFDEGIAKFPDENMLYFNKAITLNDLKRTEEALENFELSALKNPRHPGTFNAIGRIQYIQEKKIPALMALVRFMILEPTGGRAQNNLPLIEKILGGNVEKTGKKNVTIYVNPIPEGEDTVNNNFSLVEMTLSFASALDFDKKYKKESKTDRFVRKFELVCGMLSEKFVDGQGFYWDYFAPYFIALKKADQVKTLAYIVYASSGDADVIKWLNDNEAAIDSFYEWSSNFTWKQK